MKLDVTSLENASAGEIELADAVFGVPVRADILHRMVRWQLAKRRQGTHKAKGISDISGTTKKPYKQKGTGRARQGSLRSPQFRGGGRRSPAIAVVAFSFQNVEMKMRLVRLVAARIENGRKVQAGGARNRPLESAVQGRIFLAWLDCESLARLEGEAGDIDGVAACMFGDLAARGIVALPADIGGGLIQFDDRLARPGFREHGHYDVMRPSCEIGGGPAAHDRV